MARDVTITGAGGEYMDSVTVVEWCAGVGDTVRAGDTIAVVETAKAASDVEAPCDGTLAEIVADVGDELEIGAVLGRIDDGTGDAEEAPAASAAPADPPPEAAAAPDRRVREGRVVASPLARRIAAQEGVDLTTVEGTGPRGRIKRRDVERALREAPAVARQAVPEGRGAGRLFVQTRQEGGPDPVVFLHGFAADLAVWNGLLAKLGPSVSTIGVDLPGHGRSPRLKAMGSPAALADAVAETLLAEGMSRCHIVGHSLGGAVALALADSGALAVRSLTLLAPAGLGPEIDGAVLQGLARATRIESLGAWLGALFATPASVPEGYAQAVMRRRGDDALRDYQAALAGELFPDGTQGFDMRPALERFAGPVRLIWGESDRILPIRQTRGLAPHVALHRVAQVGHMPQIERPDLVARLIGETVRSAGGPR